MKTMKTTKTTKTKHPPLADVLAAAGFRVLSLYRPHAFGQHRWFAVVAPDGELGAVFCQSRACWHYFSKLHAATASSCVVERCHREGLGSAIGTESEMRTYRRNLHPSNVPRDLRQYAGIVAAMGQVLNY